MKISVSMITMNEEKNIERALSSCSFADEIVVVDGGSTDRTLDILRAHNKVVLIQRRWDDHFGRQRQASLEHCSGDWVIRLDADEAFSMAFEQNIRGLLSATADDITSYKIKQCNLAGNINYYSKRFDDYESIPRIWRNNPDIRWERHIHEILTGLKGKMMQCEVYVVHYGFLDKNRYWQKGCYYAQLPESGFDKAEQLYFREYDIQLRPSESAVADHVHEYTAGSEMPEQREIAIIGKCINILNWNNFKALSDTYNLTSCVDDESDVDYPLDVCCLIKFPCDTGGSGELTGLEFELVDKDIVITEGIASPYTFQAISAKIKFGNKVITIVSDLNPVDREMNDEMRETKEIVRRYVDLFIAVSEKSRDALLSDGIPNDRIVLLPIGANIEESDTTDLESEKIYCQLTMLIDKLFLSTFKGAILELADYSGHTQKDTLMRIRSVYSQQLQEWQGTVGQDITKSRVAEFYGDTDSYLFDLVQYNYENKNYTQWSQELFNILADLNKERGQLDILDFGGGIGSQIINVSALKGAKLSYADIPGKTFDFARWRFNRRKLSINMIDATKEAFLGNMKFDAVFAFDVIEHLVVPEESVDYLIRHIKPDGFLFIITSFVDNNGEAGWHLNVDKYTDEGFYSLIKSLGMDMINEGLPRIFRKDMELSGLIENLKTAENEDWPEDARTYMEAYIQLRPVDLNMLIKHADLCSRMGYMDAAMESLKKIRLFNPSMPEAREIEERINKENNEITSCQ